VVLVLAGVFVLAFAARLAWLLTVQSPFDAVYSDMDGYVQRADGLIADTMPSDPRILSIYPPGTHCLIALEFLILGRHSTRAVALAHAFIGAIPAPAVAALTLCLVPSLVASAVVGVVVAFWYPQVCFVSYFSSEMWFSAAVTLQALMAAQSWRRPLPLLGAGLSSAVAFVIRPQFLLTWGIQMAGRGLSLLRRPRKVAAFRRIVWLSLPLALMISVTGYRFHKLSGHWGLIAQSAGTRLWADTDVCKIESSWRAPNGDMLSYWFSPPSKPALKPSDTVTFTGFIVDPDILDRIRLERLRGVSWGDRLRRKIGNVKLLLLGNLPWPESNYHGGVSLFGTRVTVTRVELQKFFRDVLLYGVLPLSAVGLILGRRNRAMLVLAANMATIVITAAFFFGEARYHIPYDPFAIVLAVVGCYELYPHLRRLGAPLLRKASRLRRTGRASDAIEPTVS
jgi:hypothetical protein